MIGRIPLTDLRIHIEAFEYAISELSGQTMDSTTRSAFAHVRASWKLLADTAFGAIERTRACPSCQRSNVQPGPRCVFCWHRLDTRGAHAQQIGRASCRERV